MSTSFLFFAHTVVGYGGTIPRVRPEHTGKNDGEQAAHFVPHFGSAALAYTRKAAPAGGASALGTKPLEIPGTRTPAGRGIHESLLIAIKADPVVGKQQ